MKKTLYLIIIVFSLSLLVSCMPQQNCSAYGEKQRYQRTSSSWNK